MMILRIRFDWQTGCKISVLWGITILNPNISLRNFSAVPDPKKGKTDSNKNANDKTRVLTATGHQHVDVSTTAVVVK